MTTTHLTIVSEDFIPTVSLLSFFLSSQNRKMQSMEKLHCSFISDSSS
jgi:hypothetical protein